MREFQGKDRGPAGSSFSNGNGPGGAPVTITGVILGPGGSPGDCWGGHVSGAIS